MSEMGRIPSIKSAEVGVVIASRDGMPYLEAAVESVLAQHYENTSLLVLEGESNDGSVEFLNSVQDSRFRWTSSSRDISPGARRNVGAKQTQADLMLFLDSDDVLEVDSITRLVESFTESPNHVVVGGLRRFAHDELQECIPALREIEYGPAVGTTLIPRTVFHQVGMFNESLVVGEFIEWVTRARRLGIKELQTECSVLRRREHAKNRSRVLRDNYKKDLSSVIRAHLLALASAENVECRTVTSNGSHIG